VTATGALGQQRQLDKLKPACARILREDRTLLGTGYLVAKDLVATCHHVIARDVGQPLVCRFGDERPIELRGAVLRWDGLRDTALVRLAEAASMEPLPIGGDASDLAWYGYGFPAFAELLGIPLFGRVLDAHTVDKDGRPACSLHVEAFTAGLPASVGGLSGSPVISGGKVIGTVFRVLGAEDGWQKPHLGLCYATPAWTLRGLLDTPGEGDVSSRILPPEPLPPAPSVEQEKALVLRWSEGAVALEAIRLAGDATEVQRALERYVKSGLGGHQAMLVAAEAFVGIGAVQDALEVLDEVEADQAEAPAPVRRRVAQLRALATSLSGDHALAQALLDVVPGDVESAGIRGGILKRRWLDTGRRAWLEASYDAYGSQNATTPDPYLSVNVAALALQLGRAVEARAEAERTLDLVEKKPSPTYWDFASRAEALLLLGRLDEARADYRKAALGAGGPREIAVMRRQARLDLRALGRDEHGLDDVLVPGAVACVLGAPLGADFWTSERSRAARARLDQLVRDRGVAFGFGSAVRGLDLLFADVLRDRGATPTVFIPGPRAAFEDAWVGPGWRPLLARVPVGRAIVLDPDGGGRPIELTASDDAAARAAVDMGRRLDEPPILVALPPPAGAADVREIRAAMETWAARGGGEVVQVELS
jgi:hypothetical protein